jgi:SHS2 domain-containing protein
MMDKIFEEIEHTADLAIRVYGRDLKELFANAPYGMFCLMADLTALVPATSHEVHLEAPDHEALLVDWLNELLYLHEMEGEIYNRFHIKTLSPTHLAASVVGGQLEVSRATIKAVTFHDLSIEETENGYVATIVFDV